MAPGQIGLRKEVELGDHVAPAQELPAKRRPGLAHAILRRGVPTCPHLRSKPMISKTFEGGRTRSSRRTPRDRTPPGAFKALLVLVLSMSLAAVAFASPFCLCGGTASAKAAMAAERAAPSCHGSGAAPTDRDDHTDHDGGAKPDGCKMACHMPAVLGSVERLAVRVPRLEPVAELALLPAPLVAFAIDHVPLA